MKVWMDHDAEGIFQEHIFFWNNEKSEMGRLILKEPNTLHINKLIQKVRKILCKNDLREKYKFTLKFPLERYEENWR